MLFTWARRKEDFKIYILALLGTKHTSAAICLLFLKLAFLFEAEKKPR